MLECRRMNENPLIKYLLNPNCILGVKPLLFYPFLCVCICLPFLLFNCPSQSVLREMKGEARMSGERQTFGTGRAVREEGRAVGKEAGPECEGFGFQSMVGPIPVWSKLFLMGQALNIFSLVISIVSFTTSQLCHHSRKQP